MLHGAHLHASLQDPTPYLMSRLHGSMLTSCACRVPAALSIINTVLAPLYNWLLIYHFGLGLDGAAFASVLEALTYTAMLAAYLGWREARLRREGKHTLRGWSGALPRRPAALC